MRTILLLTTFGALLSAILATPAPTPVLVGEAATTAGVPINSITSLSDLPPALEASIESCTAIQSTPENTHNDIVNGVCKDFTLIFARGTFEKGNLGSLVGPPFAQELIDMLGTKKVALQGVNNYAADVAGFDAGGSVTGADDVIKLVKQTMKNCPSTKLCLSGYSQGAQVVHLAANNFTTSETAFVNSVVLYGDPDDGEAVGRIPAKKVSVVCHVGDDICLHGDIIDSQHLDYCLNTPAEAKFAVKRSGLS